MAAVGNALYPSPYAFSKFPESEKATLNKMDTEFRGRQARGSTKDLGAGVILYKLVNGKVYVVMGELQKKDPKDPRNGMYAAFSGGAKEQDFQDTTSPSFQCACREFFEELGTIVSPSLFFNAVDQNTTVVGVNAGFPHFVNPIFLVKSTPQIEEAIAKSFAPTHEIKDIAWVDVQTILASASKVDAVYASLCKEWIQKNAERLQRQFGFGVDPLSDAQRNTAIRANSRLEQVRNGTVVGETEDRALVQVAPYTARSIYQLMATFQQILHT